LEIREKLVGFNDLDVAQSLTELALLYDAEKHFADAEPLLKRSLEISEKVLGPDHPIVAQALNNMAPIQKRAGNTGKSSRLQSS
jgi:tetratricopeptide repeat protein